LLLAREGCAGICVADISAKAASAVVAELQQVATNASFRAIPCALDVVDAESVQAMIAKMVEEFGRVDYAVNCAGIGAIKNGLAETERDEWERMIAVNLTGVFACVKEEIKQMLKQAPLQARYVLACIPSPTYQLMRLTQPTALLIP
jgi:NAD(P)-dependent dehydrogenase (short-subunit alcohol dehydrogenase family)